jgi:hypothetical protein
MSERSYITDYASSQRSSRVEVTPRSYTQLTPMSAIAGEDSPPTFVLLDPTGTRVLLRGPSSLALDPKTRIGDAAFIGVAYVTEWGAILGKFEKRWDGLTQNGAENHQEQIPLYPVQITSGVQLAARLSAQRWTSVGQGIATFSTPDEIGIFSRAETDQWEEVFVARGAAAIGTDHRVVVATLDGKVRVYAPDGDAVEMLGRPRSEITVGDALSDVSITSAGTIVLARRGATTKVRLVDERAVQWSVDVGFAAGQPPIDGGDARVYIAGDGLAAIERGAVLWSTPSVVPTRATAFADGTLAVCRGPGLQIIARDGSIVQQLATSDGAPIVTPPAIGPDGSIWVATPTHVCVAR